MRSTSLSTAVTRSLQEIATADNADAGIAQLALKYAKAIDAADDRAKLAALRDLGPKLQTALIELGLTPKARAEATKPMAAMKTALETFREGRAR